MQQSCRCTEHFQLLFKSSYWTVGSNVIFSSSSQNCFLSTELLSCRVSEMKGSTAMLGGMLVAIRICSSCGCCPRPSSTTIAQRIQVEKGTRTKSRLLLLVLGRQVSSECQGEMLDYRRMLMEDFSLSPEIILSCRGEIEHHCSGLHRKGRTLHCLMKVVRGEKGNVGLNCQQAVRGLSSPWVWGAGLVKHSQAATCLSVTCYRDRKCNFGI